LSQEQTLHTVAAHGLWFVFPSCGHYLFSHTTVTCMWPLHHIPYTVLASNWLTDTTWVPSWFAFYSRSTE